MMKNFKLLLLLFLAQEAAAQKDFFDYAVIKGDTIYGTIRELAPAEYVLVRTDANLQPGDSPVIGLRNVDAIRYNDQVFVDAKGNDDPIYASSRPVIKDVYATKFGRLTAFQPKLQDYFVVGFDTIYGIIKTKKGHIRLQTTDKIITLDESVKAYRHKNEIFVKTNTEASYLKLLFDGEVKLYAHRPAQRAYNRIYGEQFRSNDLVYFVEKENQLIKISAADFPNSALLAFVDNTALVETINNKVYGYENLYLMVKFYNRTL